MQHQHVLVLDDRRSDRHHHDRDVHHKGRGLRALKPSGRAPCCRSASPERWCSYRRRRRAADSVAEAQALFQPERGDEGVGEHRDCTEGRSAAPAKPVQLKLPASPTTVNASPHHHNGKCVYGNGSVCSWFMLCAYFVRAKANAYDRVAAISWDYPCWLCDVAYCSILTSRISMLCPSAHERRGLTSCAGCGRSNALGCGLSPSSK